jgi:hypothetical protein
MATSTILWLGGHKTDLLGDAAAIDGLSSSSTVTEKLQLASSTASSSVTLQTTSVTPTGNSDPDSGTQATTELSLAPITSGSGKSTTAEQSPVSLVTAISDGQMMTTWALAGLTNPAVIASTTPAAMRLIENLLQPEDLEFM